MKDKAFIIVEIQEFADNNDMADNNFSEQLIQAIDTKTEWFDNRVLPEILENYRLLHTCVKNVFEFLLKKSLITPDPYKNEKKISDIEPPESTMFTENERSMVMGMRLSDYDNTLDFLCNYYKFSVSNLQIPNIRKLMDLNLSIQWNAFSANSNNVNTRSLCTMLLTAKQNTEAITASMVNDSLSKANKAITAINKSLKDLSNFQREYYKANIRKILFTHPDFKPTNNPAEEMSQIKKLFTQTMGKIPFYNELIEEIIAEDTADNKMQLQKALLEKLAVENTSTEKKEEKIDTKDILLTAIRVFGAMPGQILLVREKIEENHNLLESEHNSFMDKLKKALRQAFNIAEKPLFYNIVITDTSTDTRHHERLNYQQFLVELETKAKRFNSIGVKKSSGYEKLAQQSEEKILEYVNLQITDVQKMLKILNGLDEFFKSAPMPQNRSKVKGLKMEITAIKNSVVKANQHRSEYTAYIEEEAQLKKLGISNA